MDTDEKIYKTLLIITIALGVFASTLQILKWCGVF
nr:MAG TPA: hypothetical protein [Caudoviricetes sp.]